VYNDDDSNDDNNDNNNDDNINSTTDIILSNKRISKPPVKLTVNEYGQWREKRDKVIIFVDKKNNESDSDDDDYDDDDDDHHLDDAEFDTHTSKKNISSSRKFNGPMKLKTTSNSDVFLTFNDDDNDKSTIKMIPPTLISSLLEGTRVNDNSIFGCNMSKWFRDNNIEYPDTTIIVIDNENISKKIQILPFHGIARNNTNIDFLINTGGSIYSTSFIDPNSTLNESKYLAVGLGALVYQPYDMYEVGKKYSHSSLIQLWEINEEVVTTNLIYCVGLHRGPLWSIVWCPLQFEQSTNLLGIAAVVCGDGS